MKELLIEVLESFGCPVFLQGSLNEDDAYPEEFFTFWNNSTDDDTHYDNDTIGFIWSFDVNFYSTDPEKVNSMLADVRAALKAEGFIVSGIGHDVASDEKTHTGRGLDVYYRQIINRS